MDSSTTSEQRIDPGILNLASGYPEIYREDEFGEHTGSGSRVTEMARIVQEVISNRHIFDPNFPTEYKVPRQYKFSWGEETVPYDPKDQERKVVDLYWRMVAKETSAGALEVIKNRQPIFSESASYALDLVASVLKMRGITSVRLVNPCLDIFVDNLKKKNGLVVKPIGEGELHFAGADSAVDDYRRILTESNTALVVATPNNPTGAYMAEEELIELANFCREHDIPLIIDSVFRPYHSKPYDDVAVLEKSGCTYAVIGDTGKAVPTFLMKTGFIICSQDLHQEMTEMADIFGQVPLTDIVILRESIRNLSSFGFGDMLDRIEWNRARLREFVEEADKKGLMLAPCATRVPFGWLILPEGRSSTEVTRNLREKYGVAVSDGAHFYQAHSEVSALRVSLARPTGSFLHAAGRLYQGLLDL